MFGLSILYIVGGLILLRIILKRAGLITKEDEELAKKKRLKNPKIGAGFSFDWNEPDK
jgi:hypothetical protein